MNLEQYIPYEDKTFRPHQKEAIIQIIEAIECGTPTILLDAVVGAGKSLIAYCVARYFADDNYDAYIFTKTKYLQDQYLNDFKDIKTVKGRSNFPCLMSQGNTTCNTGLCKQRKKFGCPIGAEVKNKKVSLKDVSQTKYDENCRYWRTKFDAIINPISILNYPYLITDALYSQHFPLRKIGIYDEAHGLESILMTSLELELTDYQLQTDLGMNLPQKNNVTEWIDVLSTISELYREKASKTEDMIRKEYFIEKYEAVDRCHAFLKRNSENWVFNVFDKANANIGRKVRHVVFKPIEIQDYTGLLFNHAQQRILMSGSILKSDIYLEELGLDYDNCEYIEIPSLIPPKNRPIIRDYVGSMSRKNFNNTFPALVAKIKELANKHHDEKGIIHTFTYNINSQLFNAFRGDRRFIFHTNMNREEKTLEFKESDEPKIFVSPYSFEGVDFPYDDGRWQVICKMPYPYLGDAQVQARNNMDMQNHTINWGWCRRQVSLTLSQMYGRTNRASDDYSVTYLIDSDIEGYLGNASLLTDYFLEGVTDYNYQTPLKVMDETKLRSRGDNRDNQLAIMDEINNGLNTLELLRKAYKQLPGSSFIEVKKAVDYCLKCGAVVYD